MLINNDRYLKDLIEKNKLSCPFKNKDFILLNPLNLTVNELSRIAEMANSSQKDTAAYYTDPKTVSLLCKKLPIITNPQIRILEPSVGVGNILREVIKHYKDKSYSIVCDVFDINKHSLELCEILIKKEFSDLKNLKINYIHADFLTHTHLEKYDLVVGNPPFIKVIGEYRKNLQKKFNNLSANNLSAFFLDKSQELADSVVLIMPKYFLHNTDFSISRDKLKKRHIEYIIDFGETGFKGIKIETICLVINTKTVQSASAMTTVISVPQGIELLQSQKEITQEFFPNWLIYINKNFTDLAKKLDFGIFTVFRDRQITSKKLSSKGDIWVIRSKNIPRSGEGVINIEEDVFIDNESLLSLNVRKYLYRTDVYLSPNMTYYPRVVKKPSNCVVNGSVAILELLDNISLTDDDLLFFSSEKFENFYKVARNYSTRSLNIDKISIFYFGKRKSECLMKNH